MTLDHRFPDQRIVLTGQQHDRRIARLLFAGTLLVYAYFFAGQGYNQNAQFDAIRAVVERGTFTITAFARPGGPLTFTEDAYYVGDRIFSNKPPGMAIAGAPFYAMLAAVERAAGLDLGHLRVVRFNAYALTVCLAALPGAWVIVTLFGHLRAHGVAPRDASLAAAGFAFGTLLFPYGTVLMSHNLLAACLFVPWAWLSRPGPSAARVLVAGLLLGLGVLTFLPVAPLAALYPIHLLRRGGRLRGASVLAVGPALAVLVMLAYNSHYYGSPFETGARLGGEQFYEPDLLFGYFAAPDLRRLYWITIHPFRGLLYCCPVFALCLLALIDRADHARLRPNLIPGLIVVFFVVFYLTFNGWAGGFSVGPRYAIPALPFLYLFAVPAIGRYRAIAIALIAIATLNMLAVTGYNVMVPGNSVGGAMAFDPVAECYKRLTMNWVARNSESFNLGMVAGIPGVPSLVPAALLIAGVHVALWRLTRSATTGRA